MKKLLIFLSILILIGIFALSPVNATNNITLSLNKNNITYGENSDVTITLKENGTPLHNKEVKLDIYSSSVNFFGETKKTNEKGQATFNLSSLPTGYYNARMFYYDNYFYNQSDLKVNYGKAKASINLENLANYRTKITIKLTDNHENPLKGYSLDSYLNPPHKGKSLVVYKDGSWIEDGIDLISGNDLKTDNNGIITTIIDGIICKGEISFYLWDGNYKITNTVLINNKIPSKIKITETHLNSYYYFIYYSLLNHKETEINKQLKAIVDGKTYYGKNNLLLIPVGEFKKYTVKLLFDGDSTYAKSEYTHTYTLTGKEIVKDQITGKLVKKFKKFGHTYAKYKIYNIIAYLNGKIKKSFSHYETSLYSAEKYKLFKTANEKIKINGFIPSIYLKNKLRIKAYYDGNNDIKLNYYFQYKKGGISKLAGYIKIHKYKTYYSWYNKQSLLSFSSNLNKKLAIKYARIIGW
ncbi:MAG: hypothetical protein KO253_07170 [Methanobrevibacter arboriphilus]|nr:hypothetical protein [Methanobrevibacter arboriphilus]